MAADAPRHVLMTADTLGGVWNQALGLAQALAPHGVRVSLATMGAPLTAQQRAQAGLVPGLALHESAWRLEWMDDPWDDVRRAGDWLLALEAQLRPDVVHLNQFAFGNLPFVAPTLLVAHSCVASWWRAVEGEPMPMRLDRYRQTVAQGLAGAGQVAAPTYAMLDSLACNYGFLGDGIVLPNGRSADAYAPAPKTPGILCAGRLWDAAKNLEALEAVAPQIAWPVRVAGPTRGPDGKEHAPRHVHVLGELAPRGLARHYASAAIYALPARYEPFGQSVLEAALSGCALVLGDIPSLREVWGDAAIYVGPDDHAALQAALTGLIDDDARRNLFAARAFARARRYTPERMARAYLGAYRQLSRPVASNKEAACAS